MSSFEISLMVEIYKAKGGKIKKLPSRRAIGVLQGRSELLPMPAKLAHYWQAIVQ